MKDYPRELERRAQYMEDMGDDDPFLRSAAAYIRELETLANSYRAESERLRSEVAASHEQCAALMKERDEAQATCDGRERIYDGVRNELAEARREANDLKALAEEQDEEIAAHAHEIDTLRAQLAPEEFEEREGVAMFINDNRAGAYDSVPDALKAACKLDLPIGTRISFRPETIRTPVKMVPMEVWMNVYATSVSGHFSKTGADTLAAPGRRFGRALKRTILVPEK